MIFWECCSSYCKGTTVKYSRYGRTGPDRPPQPTTQRILPQLGRGWRVGEPRKCYARAWTGGRDTSFYLVTVHHGQKMQFFVKELTVDHCRAPNDRSGLLRRPPRPVRTPCEPSFPSDLRIFRTEIQPLLAYQTCSRSSIVVSSAALVSTLQPVGRAMPAGSAPPYQPIPHLCPK